MKALIVLVSIMCCLLGSAVYGVIGVGTRVDEIKERVPVEISQRGWEIVRYKGYQWGSFSNHGGRVWYHVRNTDDHSIQYKVFITLWSGELHYYYDKPEPVSRVNITYPDNGGE